MIRTLASGRDGSDEARLRDTFARLKDGDPTVFFTSIATVYNFWQIARRLGDADAADILEDMKQYGATSINELLAHYRAGVNVNRAVRRAISASLLGEEVHGAMDYVLKVTGQSRSLPVMVFVLEGWTQRATELWHAI